MTSPFWRTAQQMRPLMDKLASSEERPWSEYREAPTKGVYVFYECARPIYVGRSNRVRARLREHGADSSGRHSATFALKLLRKKLDGPAGTAKEIVERHGREYRSQRERVRAMTFRAVSVEDQLLQTLFETYAILELGTYPEYNDFDTH